tara:strand:- start:759 stop:986 length:228 start_codon:yes stop_codon:yes gene_type:complete
MSNFISLTKNNLKALEKGLCIEVRIDGKVRAYIKHCDCGVCKDYSKEFHEEYDGSEYVDEVAEAYGRGYEICGDF